MKTLVAFYSRTGKTRKVAEEMAKSLGADVDEIIDKKNRNGPLGWLSGGKDASQKSLTEIETKKDPEKYDIVIIGTPVWASSMAPAVRTYIKKGKIKKSAVFCTYEGMGADKALAEMKSLLKDSKVIAEASFKGRENNTQKLKDFIEKAK